MMVRANEDALNRMIFGKVHFKTSTRNQQAYSKAKKLKRYSFGGQSHMSL